MWVTKGVQKKFCHTCDFESRPGCPVAVLAGELGSPPSSSMYAVLTSVDSMVGFAKSGVALSNRVEGGAVRDLANAAPASMVEQSANTVDAYYADMFRSPFVA